MLHLIRNNSPYIVIILFIFTLLVKLQALSAPLLPVALPGHYFYALVLDAFSVILGTSATGYTVVAMFMLFGQALYLNNVATRRRMFSKPMYNVGFFYILLSSLSPYLSYFSELLIMNWLIIAALDILLGLHQTAQPRKNIFNAGFLLSAAALVHFPSVIYILLLLCALLLLRSLNAGEWVVAVMGYVTPVYFAAGLLFLFDVLPVLYQWPLFYFWFPHYGVATPIYTTGIGTGIAILLTAGTVSLQGNMGKIGVFIRRNWSLIAIYLLLSVAVALTTSRKIENAWLAAIPALSLVMAQPLYSEKNKRFSNFIFYFSLIFVIFCQMALNK